MAYFDPTTWQHFNKEEMLKHLEKWQNAPTEKDEAAEGEADKSLNKVMVFQNLLSPLDVYCYLKARFGEPRGMQTFLKKDDSDNVFHWDYNIKAGQKDLYFVGATQEVHVWVDDDFSDADWINFANALKADFGRVGKDKSKVLKELEKWVILPNHFVSTANECGEYYHEIKRSLKKLRRISKPVGKTGYDSDFKQLLNKQGRSVQKISSACIKLNILMPVMFESFLGLLIAILVRPEVRANGPIYKSFIRSNLDVKILDLATRCEGFAKPISPNNESMGRFWSVVNRRNDVIHGNLDVEKDGMDTVYFDGKTPLFRSGGDRIQSHWEGMVQNHQPERVLEDYEATHAFIYEIISHLESSMQSQIKMLIAEDSPGWDAKRSIFGKLFPSHVMSFTMDGLRYDSELEESPAIEG